MIKTLFFQQYLLHLGLENFSSHHYLYQKTLFFFIIQIWGPPLHCTSDRPGQLIIFPIEKSLHKFFFQTFLVHEYFFLFPLLDFYFCFCPLPPPHHFSNGPPLKAMLHGAIFLATCNAILLLRDVKLPSTSLHYTPPVNSIYIFNNYTKD